MDSSIFAHQKLLQLMDEKKFSSVFDGLTELNDPLLALSTLAQAIAELLLSRRYEDLLELQRSFPTDDPLAYIIHLAASCYYASVGNMRMTDRSLRESTRSVFQLASMPWMQDSSLRREIFPVIFQQCAYIDTDLPLSNKLPEVIISPPLSSSAAELVIFASCNGLYFDHFGSEFVRSCKVFGTSILCHLHVINPTVETATQIEKLQKEVHFPIRYTSEIISPNVLYYSCRRFILAPHLLQKYKSDLIVADIDTTFTAEAPQLKSWMKSYDGGVFEYPGNDPMLLCHCSLGYYRYTPQAERLLCLTGNYIADKMREMPDLWTLDQCALLLLTRQAMHSELGQAWGDLPPIEWQDLGQLTGKSLEAFQLEQKITHEEKQKLRRSGQSDFFKLDQYQIKLQNNLRPAFEKK